MDSCAFAIATGISPRRAYALGTPNAGRREIFEKEGAQERNLRPGQTGVRFMAT